MKIVERLEQINERPSVALFLLMNWEPKIHPQKVVSVAEILGEDSDRVNAFWGFWALPVTTRLITNEGFLFVLVRLGICILMKTSSQSTGWPTFCPNGFQVVFCNNLFTATNLMISWLRILNLVHVVLLYKDYMSKAAWWHLLLEGQDGVVNI